MVFPSYVDDSWSDWDKEVEETKKTALAHMAKLDSSSRGDAISSTAGAVRVSLLDGSTYLLSLFSLMRMMWRWKSRLIFFGHPAVPHDIGHQSPPLIGARRFLISIYMDMGSLQIQSIPLSIVQQNEWRKARKEERKFVSLVKVCFLIHHKGRRIEQNYKICLIARQSETGLLVLCW